MDTPPKNSIPLATAQRWAAAWRAASSTNIKAYLIPQDDITDLMNETDVQDVRAYCGIDDEGEYKLMLVGVDKDGNDLIDESMGMYVYDFTLPCPNNCDVNSPLYTLQ